MEEKFDYSRHYLKWHNESPTHVASMVKFHQDQIRRYIEYLPPLTRTLDIGCGMGFTMLALQSLGFQCIEGIDTSPDQIAFCQRKNLNVALVDDTHQFLIRNPLSYGIIVSFDVLEHIPVKNQISFCRSIYNALAPSGIFICTVPNANSVLAARWRYIDWTHNSSFTEHSLDFCLYNGGFREISIVPQEFRHRPRCAWLPRRATIYWLLFAFFRSVRRLQMIAELSPLEAKSIPLSLNLMAICKK